MNTRLLQLIRYKTGGSQRAFALLMGWTPPYLAKLLRGDGFGLQPVLTILERLPEVDARWLLLGQGTMLRDSHMARLRSQAHSVAASMLDIERYMPVMNADDLHAVECSILGSFAPEFTPADILRWQNSLAERDARINDAMARSLNPQPPCNPPKAKK